MQFRQHKVIFPGAGLRFLLTAEAGSDGNIATLLAAGEDYSLSGTVRAKNANLAKLQQAHKKIHDSIYPMMERLRLLSPKQREAVTELMAKGGEMEENIEALKKEIGEITGESRNRNVNEIRILKALHPGARRDKAQILTTGTIATLPRLSVSRARPKVWWRCPFPTGPRWR